MEHFPFYLGLIVAIVLLIMLASKIKVAYPVLLVLAGLGISFIPGIPSIYAYRLRTYFHPLPAPIVIRGCLGLFHGRNYGIGVVLSAALPLW